LESGTSAKLLLAELQQQYARSRCSRSGVAAEL
jgi:hypothetical protein